MCVCVCVCTLLQCRDEWISNLIDDLDEGGDAYEYIKHLTDIHRYGDVQGAKH